jgi:hypothetical protein
VDGQARQALTRLATLVIRVDDHSLRKQDATLRFRVNIGRERDSRECRTDLGDANQTKRKMECKLKMLGLAAVAVMALMAFVGGFFGSGNCAPQAVPVVTLGKR